MRIGIFTDTYTPHINGVVTSVLMLKKSLEKRGHIVYLVTVNAENMQYQYEENGKVIRIPGIPCGIYDYRLTTIYPIKLIKMIKKWNLDVIHSQTEFGIGTFARILSKQLHIPLVHTYHTMYEDYVHYITHGYFDRASKKLAEYLTLFYCDKTITELIVPTKKTYELFKKKYKVDRNVYIVPTGIDAEKFYQENNPKLNIIKKREQLGLEKNDFVILFVGRIATEKNLDLLLSAMSSLGEVSKKIKLLVVGDGPDLDNYRCYVEKNGLLDNVIFTGKVPWHKISEYYLIADVFATASKTETQGLTVIEAMAASLPVVVIEDESFTDTVIHNLNGMIFRNKREYRKSIIRLFEDKVLRKRISKQAKISAEMHSSKYFADQILDVYRIAIKGMEEPKIPLFSKIQKMFRNSDELEDKDEKDNNIKS